MFLRYHNSHLECETQFTNNISSYNVICELHKNNQKNESACGYQNQKPHKQDLDGSLSDNIKLATSM